MFESFESELEALHITLEALGFELDHPTINNKYQWFYKPNGTKISYNRSSVNPLVFSNLQIKPRPFQLPPRNGLIRALNCNTKFGHILGSNKSIEFVIRGC